MPISDQTILAPSVNARPKVVLVGGPDIDARLPLMQCLREGYDISALGSVPMLHDKFLAEDFRYYQYHLNRKVNPASDLLTISQLVSTFRRLKPEIVHAFDTKPGVWGCLAARMSGVPIVIGTVTGLGTLYVYDTLQARLVRSVYESLQKVAFNLSDLCIFQNHDDARKFVAAGLVPDEKQMVILGSGVDTDAFSPDRVSDEVLARLRGDLGLEADEIVVAMISRVVRSKGVHEFGAAAEEVRARHPKVRFLLVGPMDNESSDRLNFKDQARLRETVIWPGTVQDILSVLAVSNVLVLPSYREGIPRILLEGASMGLPIVTTDTAGCNEVVKDGLNGYLVPVRNSAALSQAISRLVEQPKLRRKFGRNSRQWAVERFDTSIVADQTRSVYQQLLVRKDLS